MRYVCTGTRSERPPYLAERAQSKYGLIRGRQPCARKRRAQYGYMIGQVRHSAAHKSPEARFTLAPYLGRGSVSRKRVNSAEFQGARRVSHSRSFFPKRKITSVDFRCCFTMSLGILKGSVFSLAYTTKKVGHNGQSFGGVSYTEDTTFQYTKQGCQNSPAGCSWVVLVSPPGI